MDNNRPNEELHLSGYNQLSSQLNQSFVDMYSDALHSDITVMCQGSEISASYPDNHINVTRVVRGTTKLACVWKLGEMYAVITYS
jgi:hypothetical protein